MKILKKIAKLFKSDDEELIRIIKKQDEQIQILTSLVSANRLQAPALALVDNSRQARSQELVDPIVFGVTPMVTSRSRNDWSTGLKKFVKMDSRFDRIIFPENLPIETSDPILSREIKGHVEELKKVVNGARFFNIVPIDKIKDMCSCGTKDSERILRLLNKYHCKDLAEEDPELWEKLPDILNYIFSNGAVPLNWD